MFGENYTGIAPALLHGGPSRPTPAQLGNALAVPAPKLTVVEQANMLIDGTLDLVAVANRLSNAISIDETRTEVDKSDRGYPVSLTDKLDVAKSHLYDAIYRLNRMAASLGY